MARWFRVCFPLSSKPQSLLQSKIKIAQSQPYFSGNGTSLHAQIEAVTAGGRRKAPLPSTKASVAVGKKKFICVLLEGKGVRGGGDYILSKSLAQQVIVK